MVLNKIIILLLIIFHFSLFFNPWVVINLSNSLSLSLCDLRLLFLIKIKMVDIKVSKNEAEYDPYVEELEGKSRDISHQAVWTLSSCKPGYGVENLIDNCLETFWQSDGPQPHMVNMQFKQKTKIKDICIYADYKLDESYTPSRISIKAGTHFNDLREITTFDLQEPSGNNFIYTIPWYLK